MNETVEGLGLQEGDVLAISDNAGVSSALKRSLTMTMWSLLLIILTPKCF